MTLRLTVLGCSGSGPAPGNPASGYLVEGADTAIWIDAGTGTFMALAEQMAPEHLDAVVVSHLHPDHSADLLGYAQYLSHRLGVDRPVPVLLPDGGEERYRAYFGGGGRATLSSLAFDQVGDGDERQVGALTLTFALTTHPIPTVAVRVTDGERTLVYSADTGPGGGFPGLATGADVVLCEAGLAETGGDEARRYPYHLNAAEAGQIAADAGSDRLVVTHLAPTLGATHAIDTARSTFGGVVDVAIPGMQLII